MKDSFSRTTSGRIVIASSGVVLMTIALMAFAGLPIWSPFVMAVPLCAGMAGIFAVGIAVQEDRLGIATALIFGYPVMGMALVLGYFSAAGLNGLAAAVFAMLGVIAVAKAVVPNVTGSLQETRVHA